MLDVDSISGLMHVDLHFHIGYGYDGMILALL